MLELYRYIPGFSTQNVIFAHTTLEREVFSPNREKGAFNARKLFLQVGANPNCECF